MTKQTMKVHLINPNAIDENRAYLYFETDDTTRKRFNANLKNGIADEKVYTISIDYVRLNTNTTWVYYDVHKIIDQADLFMLVESTDFENDEPKAYVYSKEEMLRIAEKLNCKEDIKYIKKIA